MCAEHSFVVCVSRRAAFRSGVGCAECSCASKDACKKVICRVRRLTSPQAVQRNIMCLHDWTSSGQVHFMLEGDTVKTQALPVEPSAMTM